MPERLDRQAPSRHPEAGAAAPAPTIWAALDEPPAEQPVDAHEHDVVRWLLLVGATLLGAVLAGLAQRRWWRRAGALPGPAAPPSRAASSRASTVLRAAARRSRPARPARRRREGAGDPTHGGGAPSSRMKGPS
jgi:hypothetical protein